MIKKILLVLLAILVILQFFRPKKNIATTPPTGDMAAAFPVPDDVLGSLKRSCYDCHSDNTTYPWYFGIQPVAWWMQNHVDDGKRELNFSEFSTYEPKRQFRKFKEISRQIKEDGMPLDSYLWIHKDAKLTEAQKTSIIHWADSLGSQIKAKYNLPDPPERRRED